MKYTIEQLSKLESVFIMLYGNNFEEESDFTSAFLNWIDSLTF